MCLKEGGREVVPLIKAPPRVGEGRREEKESEGARKGEEGASSMRPLKYV